jgi:hypothetical protein
MFSAAKLHENMFGSFEHETHGEAFSSEKLNGRDHLSNTNVRGKTILKRTLKKSGVKMRIQFQPA